MSQNSQENTCIGALFNKVAGFRSEALLKRDSGTVIFSKYIETSFYRAPVCLFLHFLCYSMVLATRFNVEKGSGFQFFSKKRENYCFCKESPEPEN